MSQEQQEQMLRYYEAASQAYKNWGLDTDRPTIYALHCGYHLEGITNNHYEEIKELTRQVIDFAQIKDHQFILDAGCGTGVLAFDIASLHPSTTVHGINIAQFQLSVAEELQKKESYPNLFFSLQDYMKTHFMNWIFDRIIFCESLAHASDKYEALCEATRLLKPNGRLVIIDAFKTQQCLQPEDVDLIKEVEEGFHLGPYITLSKLQEYLQYLHFRHIEIKDVSTQVKPSVELMANHAQMRLEENNTAEEIITLSRKGCLATYKALQSQVLAYYFIGAEY